MLRRYDEVMLDKANKTSLLELEKKCNDKFAKKRFYEDMNEGIENKLKEQQEQITKLTDTVKELNANLSKEIHSAVRRVATNILQQHQNENQSPSKMSVMQKH